MIGKTISHYRIIDKLGQGGMGIVYSAHDATLDRQVAIKILPDTIAQDSERRERFAREARAVAALNHPNVVSIYGIEKSGGTLLLVMELVEGQQLTASFPSGGLPLKGFLPLAIQLADAVSAAHQRGIIHRDLKPANIMVTNEGRVKILDFGLAKLKEGATDASTAMDPRLTIKGHIVGTVAYMSPEQAEGKPVDHRTDIFSLGIILYQMATGEHPFRGETNLAMLSAIIKDTPGSVTDLNPNLPRELGRIIKHCLVKDPEHRYQSAKDLRNDLEELKGEVDSGGVVTPATSLTSGAPSIVPAKKSGQHWLITAAAAAILVIILGIILGWRVIAPGPTPKQPGTPAPSTAALDPTRIVVAPFENKTGDPLLDAVGSMAADYLTRGLSQIRGIEAVPIGGAALLGGGMINPQKLGPGQDPIRVLADQTGSGTVVTGSYYLQGDNLQMHARIIDARNGALLYATEPLIGPQKNTSVIEAMRQKVMGAVAVRFDPLTSAVVMDPPSYEAYREFINGVELFGKDYAQAIRHFQRATELDQDFFMPALYISVAYSNQREYAKAESILNRLYQNRDRYAPIDRLWVDSYRASLSRRESEELRILREIEKDVPRLWDVKYLIGLTALHLNLPRTTVDTYGKTEFPEWVWRGVGGEMWLNQLSRAYHVLGEYQQELSVIAQARSHYPDMLRVRVNEARALAALGRLEELNRAVEESLRMPDSPAAPGDVMAEAADELRAHGRAADSLVIARRAVDWHRGRPRMSKPEEEEKARAALGAALYQAERWEEAREVFAKLSMEHRENIDYRGRLGTLAARVGNRKEASQIADALGLLDRPYLFGQNTAWRARITALLGEKDAAVALLRRSYAEGRGDYLTLHRDQDLESIRDYPPFQELLRPKG